MKVVVTSSNPVKINCAAIGFEKMFPEEIWETVSVPTKSDVRTQPMSYEESYQGALNRVENLAEEYDFAVGIEGGVEETQHGMESFAWVVIKERTGSLGKAKTATYILPPNVALLVKQGKELGEADDIVFQASNSKQKNGSVGLLTGDVITRTSYYVDAVIMALIPFKNRELY